MGNYSTKRYSTIVDAGISGGASSYADVNSLPASPSQGDIALVTGTNKLYVYDGSNWFNIAIVNQAPTAISGNQANYTLALDGTPTVVTLVSTDPEGFPLTWSATTSGDTQVGTVTNVDNVFTITPSTDQADIGTLSVTFSVTDGNNTETSVSSFTLAFLSPLWDETVLSIGTSSTDGLTNSTFIDRSTNAHTVTPTGTPTQTSFHPYLNAWSNYTAATSYLSAPNHADFNLSGNVSFTIEAWVYRTGSGTKYWEWVAGKRATSSPYPFSWSFGIGGGTSGLNRVAFGDNTSSILGTTELELNRWHHIAASYDGTTCRVFLDGVLENSGSQAISEVNIPLTIGNYTVDNQTFEGYISNLRLVKGTCLYTTNFTPSTEPLDAITNTVLLTCQSNRFIDNGSTGHTLTPNGDVKVKSLNPFGQGSEYDPTNNIGSGYFVRANSQRIAGPNAILPGGGGGTGSDFTVEGWVYPNNVSANHTIIAQATGASGDNGRSGISLVHSGQYLGTGIGESFGMNSNGVATFDYYAWNHFVWQRSGSTYSLYLNGERVAQATNTNKAIDGGQFRIGTMWDGDGTGLNPTDGYISDIRVTYSAVYDGGTSITVPTSAVGGSSAEFYVPFDNAGVFDKTGNNELKLYGNTQTSSVVTKYGSTSLKFDGTHDIIMLNPGNWRYGDYTLELWAYFNSVSGNIYLIDHGGGNNGQLQYNAGSFGMTNSSGSLIVSEGGSPLSSGQWYHFAVTREGSTVRLFRDGVLKSTGTNSETYSDVQMCIGNTLYSGINSYSAWFNGYMQDIQILKGVAKYTTNFTPPNSTQGRTYQAES